MSFSSPPAPRCCPSVPDVGAAAAGVASWAANAQPFLCDPGDVALALATFASIIAAAAPIPNEPARVTKSLREISPDFRRSKSAEKGPISAMSAAHLRDCEYPCTPTWRKKGVDIQHTGMCSAHIDPTGMGSTG